MQKINFCDALAKPGRYAIDQQRLIWIVSGWTALLIVIFALQVFFGIFQYIQVSYVSHQESNISARLKKLIEENPKINYVRELEKSVIASMNKVDKQKNFIEKMTEFKTQQLQFKPSDYLYELSNAAIPQVWLTHMEFSSQGQQVDLSGFTYSSSKLAQYVTRLQNEPHFKDKVFSKISVNEAKSENKKQIPFNLSTQKKENNSGSRSAG